MERSSYILWISDNEPVNQNLFNMVRDTRSIILEARQVATFAADAHVSHLVRMTVTDRGSANAREILGRRDNVNLPQF